MQSPVERPSWGEKQEGIQESIGEGRKAETKGGEQQKLKFSRS